MNTMKKMMSFVLAVVMMCALCVTSFAANTPVDVSKHTFDAYQIFTGTWDAAKSELGAIEWGSGVNGDALLTALKAADAKYADCDSAAAVAKVVSGFAVNSADAKAFAKLVEANLTTTKKAVANGDTIDAGYYLIVDSTNVSGKEDDAANLSLLSVGTTVTIASKNDYPSVEKKVQDINDSTDTEAGKLQDSADYDIGDDVPFTLTGTIPSNYDLYKTYTYEFHDTYCAGLDAPANIVVKVDGTTVDASKYTVERGTGTFAIKFDDLKTKVPAAKANSQVVVTYTAKLNENAVLGSLGNPNKVYLEYSNNPNAGGDGEKGKTPEDKVIVFTYKVVVNKYKNEVKDGNQLAGAEFTLSKVNKDNTSTVVKTYTISETDPKTTTFTFKGLDDGVYKLVETKVPAGYNKMEDVIFTVTADHDETWEGQEQTEVLNSLTGSDKDSVITFTPVDEELATGETSVNAGLSADVINKSGATLPSTGGIGTTIFYVIGSILMIGAGVLLITKRRMNAR